MTDIEPVSPGEILLKEFLEPMHISPKQFAKICLCGCALSGN